MWNVGFTLPKGKNKIKCITKLTETNKMFDNAVGHLSDLSPFNTCFDGDSSFLIMKFFMALPFITS